MGNETSRLSRLAKFTRIQKFSSHEAQTTTHLKTNSFQGLLPNGQSEDQQADAAFLAQEQHASGDNIAAAIRDAAEDSSPYAPGPAADQNQGLLPSEAPGPDPDMVDSVGAQSADRASPCTPVEITKSEASEFHKASTGDGADATETASEPVKRNSQRGNSRHIEDGETKNIRAQSQVMGGRCSASAGSRSSGASQTPAQQRSSAAACSRGNSQESFLRRNRTHSLRTDRNSRGLLSDKKMTAGMDSKDGGCHTAPALGTPFPKRPIACKLSAKTWAKLEELFRLMDQDGSNAVTREEARAFFKGAFSNLSADAMFNEVDADHSGAITSEEFVKFWTQVRSSGYKEQDILEEVSELIEGGTWVDWKDGKDTYAHVEKFPKRPMLCRLSSSTWKKCEELFYKISGSDKEMQITRDKAQAFFKGAFGLISADAMFNEIDVKHHGIIHAKDFMAFWVQVKSAGYKEKDIMEEIECLMDGNPWVDWKDGRKT